MKFLLMAIALLACTCGPAKLETEPDSGTDSYVDDRSWITWDECGHNIGENPCNFALLDHQGNEVELYDHYGKVIVVDFSAMWCGICVNIAAEGDALISKYGEENVIWLTVLIDNESGQPPSQADLQRWVDMANIKAPVLGGDRNLIDYSANDGWPITSWPTMAVIDQEMVLRHGLNGWNGTAIDSWVNGLLQ